MERLTKLNSVQSNLVNAILSCGSSEGFSCSILASVAVGKSFIFYKLLYEMLKLGWLHEGDTIFFWAETNIREANMKREADKFASIYKVYPLLDFNIRFVTYQSFATGSRVFDCYDEYDVALSAKYSLNIINSPARFKLGLSGTEESSATVFKDAVASELTGLVRQGEEATNSGHITSFINKGELRQVLLPRVATYLTSNAIADGLISGLQTIVIDHELDSVNRVIKPWKTKDTLLSESKAYEVLEKGRTNFKATRFMRLAAARKQVSMVQRLPSKIAVAKRLLSMIGGKSIVFSIDTSLLYPVTANVVTNRSNASFVLGDWFYSSPKSAKTGKIRYRKRGILSLEEKDVKKKEYDEAYSYFCMLHPEKDFIDLFDKEQINVIASAQKLGRGITLKGVRNAVFLSYHSTHDAMLQRVGRLLRHEEGKDYGRLYIFRTRNTWEETWFSEMRKRYNEQGTLEEEFDLNIVRTLSSKNIQRL